MRTDELSNIINEHTLNCILQRCRASSVSLVQCLDESGQWYNVEGTEHVTFDDSSGPSPVLVLKIRKA